MSAGLPSPSGWYSAAFGPAPTKKILYLTFDDGPSKETTPQVLKLLKANGAHATFFMTGWASVYKGLVRKVYQQGNAIGDHTRTHVDLTKASNKEIKAQLGFVADKVGPIMGNCMRPPFGMIDQRVGKIVEGMGLTPIFWTGHAQDWAPPSLQTMESMLKEHTKPGAVILLHDSKEHPNTLEALAAMLPWWKQQGYEFDTIPACRK